MNSKILWLVLSCLMVTVLLVGSCAPAEKPTPTPTPAPAPAPTPAPTPAPAPEKEMVRNTAGKLVEKPRYGGVNILGKDTQGLGFDDSTGAFPWNTHELHLTHEYLFRGDWTQGLAGTGAYGYIFLTSGIPGLQYTRGTVAERFELSDPNTVVFHIRKGIHFQLDPKSEASRLVGGRELTAHDVAVTLKRNVESPISYLSTASESHQRPVSVTAPDKWTVVVKWSPSFDGGVFEVLAKLMAIWPGEMDKYDRRDWKNVRGTGTGPFILVDFVPQTSATFVRNPNYWGKDPLLPDYQLPYLDGVRHLVIPDLSTRLAALRTAKIDCLHNLASDEAKQLKQSTPDLKWTRFLYSSPYQIFMRTDKAPYSDVRVRRALAMAIDNEAIARDYYGGEAEILTYPVAPVPEHSDMYIPLEKHSPSVRELYEYHPDKAKQLLAEAGYPKGFKTSVVCYATGTQVDLLSIIKDYWAKIGVDLTIDAKEYGIWTSMTRARTHLHMCYMYSSFLVHPEKFYIFRPGFQHNMSYIDDKRMLDTYKECAANYWDPKKRHHLFKEVVPYILEQAWWIHPPGPYLNTFWWPWLKNFHGEYAVGYMDLFSYPIYAWVDQNLKEKMTGRR